MKKFLLLMIVIVAITSCTEEEYITPEVNIDYLFELTYIGYDVDELEDLMSTVNELDFYCKTYSMDGDCRRIVYVDNRYDIFLTFRTLYQKTHVVNITIPYEAIPFSDLVDYLDNNYENDKDGYSWVHGDYLWTLKFDEIKKVSVIEFY